MKGSGLPRWKVNSQYSRTELTCKAESKSSSIEELQDPDGQIKPEFFSDHDPMYTNCRGWGGRGIEVENQVDECSNESGKCMVTLETKIVK